MTTRILRVVVAASLTFGAADAVAETATAVSAGAGFTCAVTAGGGVECWGQNTVGQLGDGTTTSRSTPAAVIGLPGPVQAVAAGQSYACALTTSGGVVCWGRNAFGELGDGTTTNRLTPVGVSGLSSGVLAVAVRNFHSCAVTNTGAAMCWGRNDSGQLGNGTTTERHTPTPVTGLSSGVVAIAAGSSHTCALTTGGAALCWGNNGTGQLGDGTTTNRLTPIPVSGLSGGVEKLATGGGHTCAVMTGGAVLCWGYNVSGQLGDGTTTDRLTPTPVSGLSAGVGTVAVGDSFSCAVMTGGAALCWGDNYFGQLGDGTTSDRPTPIPVGGLPGGVSSITAGQMHTCAVTTGGDVTCWGGNWTGQLGDGTTAIRPTATPVTSLASGVASIAVGRTVCATTSGGAAMCWGANRYGQLGDGTTTIRLVPTPVSGLGSGVEAIATGSQHVCAVTTGGAALCWGWNAYGQLGDGTTTDRWTPTPVSGLESGVLAIAAGGSHTCALMTGGAVRCWGSNAYGQLGNGTAVTPWTTPTAVSGLESGGAAAIVTGYRHSCAVTTGGAAKCWGDNSMGQLGDWTYQNRLTPTQVYGLGTGVAAIAAGAQHTCALTTGGGALCWGTNWTGQLGDGTTTDQVRPWGVSGLSSDVAGLAAGSAHTCAVTTGGSALCWGYNDYGQLGDGTTTSRSLPTAVVGLAGGTAAIVPGEENTCAISTGGGVVCWGNSNLIGARVTGMTPLAVYGFGGAIAAGAVSPSHGPANGGTAVLISGAYFLQGATVTIGGVAATVVSAISTTEILAVTGPHAPGAADVVVTNPDAEHSVLAGSFTYDAAQSVPGSDFTGDLTSDILWRHATGGDLWLWPMDGGAKAGDAYVGVVGDTNWEIRGQGDFDADGTADLLWRHKTDGTIYYWKMDAGAPAAELYVATVDPSYDVVGTADFDGDRRADILWRNPTLGDLWLWQMNGADVLAQQYVDTVDPGYTVKGLGDLNADAKADIVWAGAGGDIWAWLMNGASRDAQAYVQTVADTAYQIQQVADFDGDGKADLLWWNASAGDVWIWRMNGVAVESEHYVGTVPDTNYRIMAAGDYNGDGKADIIWRNLVAGDLWVWLMDGPAKESERYVGVVADQGYQIVR